MVGSLCSLSYLGGTLDESSTTDWCSGNGTHDCIHLQQYRKRGTKRLWWEQWCFDSLEDMEGCFLMMLTKALSCMVDILVLCHCVCLTFGHSSIFFTLCFKHTDLPKCLTLCFLSAITANAYDITAVNNLKWSHTPCHRAVLAGRTCLISLALNTWIHYQ